MLLKFQAKDEVITTITTTTTNFKVLKIMPRILSFIPPILALTPLWVLAQCCSSYSVKLMPSEWGRSQGKCPPKAELRGALTLLPLGMGGVPQCKRPPKAKPRGPLPCYTPRSRGVPKVRTLPRWSPRGGPYLVTPRSGAFPKVS